MSTFPILQKKMPPANFVATRNACKLCTPLGAVLAFRGVEGALPFLHGSQGCATYMRRYIISHFREPMDIAASNISEASTVFGGIETFRQGIHNVQSQYHPALIGIATTCLTETIGEDMNLLLNRLQQGDNADVLPILVPVSTPSYSGSHIDGFHGAVLSLVTSLSEDDGRTRTQVNLFPGMVSPADLRYLKEIMEDFGLPIALLPDYSETLDGPSLTEYRKIPAGGTPIASIRATGSARCSIEFGHTLRLEKTAAAYLEKTWRVPAHRLGMPIGAHETDAFFAELEQIAGCETPQKHALERGRLIDAYVDGHKYVFGKRAIVYGEEDFVIGMVAFLAEIGVIPVLAASGGESGHFAEAIAEVAPDLFGQITVHEGMDFLSMEEAARNLKADFVLGNSKGYTLSRHLQLPLVRVGFPIHDRFGGHRTLHLGYRGAQMLFDHIVNTLLEKKQDDSSIGYSYL
jgi:nitrogenase molybdenum-iron protein NifN